MGRPSDGEVRICGHGLFSGPELSFIVMREHGVDAALTSDEDFVQAGFKRLMDPSPRGVREPASPSYGTWVRMLGPMRAQL